MCIISLIQACDKEQLTSEESTAELIKNREEKENKNGQLLTAKREPVVNAVIKINNEKAAVSDKKGSFSIHNDELQVGDVITIEHIDYVTVSKVVREHTSLFFSLKKRANKVIFNAKEEMAIAIESDGKMIIPENAFTYKGEPYVGKVAIQATYIDVNNQSEVQSAPGSYIAINTDNSLYPLMSYGMIEVRAVIAEENIPLDLREGVSLTTFFPIRTAEVPEEVNLYELDRDTGYWTLTGMLVKDGNVLKGKITSVNSAWNADDPCADQLVCVRIRVAYTTYVNPPYNIGATGITYNGFDGHHTPDANGYVELWVCPNSVFELGSAWIGGSNPLYTTTIDLNTVTMNPNGCTDLGTWTIQN